MTTTKSFSNNRFFSIYKTALKGQLPVAIVVAIGSVLALPVIYFSALSSQASRYESISQANNLDFYRSFFGSGVYLEFAQSGVICAAMLVITIFSALLANGYMHSKRRTDLYHALPVRRSTLLLANMAGSLTAILGPFIAVYLITMAMQLIGYGYLGLFGAGYFAFCAADLFAIVVYVAVTYTFTTLIAVNVGTALDTLAVTGAIGFMPTFLYLIGGKLWAGLTYGAQFRAGWAMVISPFLYCFQRFGHVDYDSSLNLTIYHYGPMLRPILAWLAIAVVMLWGAIACYSRRGSELAGQTQSGGPLQVVSMAFIAFLGAILFYVIFVEMGLVIRLILMMLGALLIGVVASLIFARGARRLLQNILWLGAGGVIACAMILCFRFDAAGYVHRIPRSEEVASVTISYAGRFDDLSAREMRTYYSSSFGVPDRDEWSGAAVLTQPQSIAAVLDAHAKAVENQPGTDAESDYYYGTSIRYTLTNGRTMRRYYDSVSSAALDALANLEDKEDFITQRHPVFLMDSIPGISQADLIHSVNVNDALRTKDEDSLSLGTAELQKLIDAVQQDMLEDSLADIRDPSRPALGYITIFYHNADTVERRFGDDNALIRRHQDMSVDTAFVLVNANHARTLAALRELGLYDRLSPAPIDKIHLLSFESTFAQYSSCRVNVAMNSRFAYTWEFVELQKEGRLSDSLSKDAEDPYYRYIEVDDPALIAQVAAAGKWQAYLDKSRPPRYVMAVAEAGGEPRGYCYVAVSDLPASLAGQMEALENEILRQSYGEGLQGEIILPQAAAA